LTFANTGREHPATYDFVRDLEQGLGREIVWLELRPPKVHGGPPRDFEFERVTYATADRRGGPFNILLRCLAEYRATKGWGRCPRGPVSASAPRT